MRVRFPLPAPLFVFVVNPKNRRQKIMKTFLKLTVALFAFGFATVNAATAEQKAAAIKAVTDAIATGDESKVKEAVSAQVAKYPELAGDIVSAALNVSGISEALSKAVVKTAAFTAPGEKGNIINKINAIKGMDKTLRSTLIKIVKDAAKDGAKKGNNGSGPPTDPPPAS
jgi:hypothetical protein